MTEISALANARVRSHPGGRAECRCPGVRTRGASRGVPACQVSRPDIRSTARGSGTRRPRGAGCSPLCLDTGHVAYRYGDNAALLERFTKRIEYLHFKQVDPAVLATATAQDLGFAQAVAAGVTCEPPAGVPTIASLAAPALLRARLPGLRCGRAAAHVLLPAAGRQPVWGSPGDAASRSRCGRAATIHSGTLVRVRHDARVSVNT